MSNKKLTSIPEPPDVKSKFEDFERFKKTLQVASNSRDDLNRDIIHSLLRLVERSEAQQKEIEAMKVMVNEMQEQKQISQDCAYENKPCPPDCVNKGLGFSSIDCCKIDIEKRK